MLPAREARWATRRKDREARNMMKERNIRISIGALDVLTQIAKLDR